MHRFVALCGEEKKHKKIYLHFTPDGKKFRQVLWGDWLQIDTDDPNVPDDWLKVLWAQGKDKNGVQLAPIEAYILEEHTSRDRPLEMIFLDVGQGDSAILISPERGTDERIMIIDAGIGDNLDRYLNARFKYKTNGFHIHAAIVTHPDEDHYGGFRPVFGNGNLTFDHIYHNGLGERPVDAGKGSGHASRMGATAKDPVNKKTYHTALLETLADTTALYGGALPSGTGQIGNMEFPQLMNTALTNLPNADISMLSTAHGIEVDNRTWMPGFSPEDDQGFTIEVLGPVVEPDAQGRARLRRLGDNGKTKNGHSVLLRLQFGRFSVMFGGDLNSNAEKFLLQHYGGGLDNWPTKNEHRQAMITSARHWLQSDLLKVCHHGAADVTDEFLQAVNPVAFIISSGDEEGHVHPRPDLLGRLGRNGRGFAPLLLSTELQRSTREREDVKDRVQVEKGVATLASTLGDRTADENKRLKAQDAIADALRRLARTNVSVYGSIHVKTDGQTLIVAFRIEVDSLTKRWHYYEYQQDVNGTLVPLHEVA